MLPSNLVRNCASSITQNLHFYIHKWNVLEWFITKINCSTNYEWWTSDGMGVLRRQLWLVASVYSGTIRFAVVVCFALSYLYCFFCSCLLICAVGNTSMAVWWLKTIKNYYESPNDSRRTPLFEKQKSRKRRPIEECKKTVLYCESCKNFIRKFRN